MKQAIEGEKVTQPGAFQRVHGLVGAAFAARFGRGFFAIIVSKFSLFSR
jgi:hypothetical protein